MKKNFRATAVLLSLLFTTGTAMAAKTVPIVDKSVVLDEKSTRTLEQIRTYILYSAETFRPELKSKIESDAPGTLQLEFNKQDTYYVSVLFTYDNAGFKANYVSSRNLNYGESAGGKRVIHENYMIWIDEIIKLAKAAYGMQLNAKGEVTAPDAAAELIFRSTGASDTVAFYSRDETSLCGRYDEFGKVANLSDAEIAAREQEWAAKAKARAAEGRTLDPLLLRPRTLSAHVVALRPIQISTSSSAYFSDDSDTPAMNGTSARVARHTCGPLTFKFTPQGARKYAIEYAVSYELSRHGMCTQNVFDVTNPDQRIPVPAEQVDIAKINCPPQLTTARNQ